MHKMKDFIRLKSINKSYGGGVRALNNINLSIAEGEFLAVLGKSGSGKSTLMNILGCLDTPDSGEYYLDNLDMFMRSDRQLSEIRNRKIGFVFQGFNLIPALNALENVELPLLYRGLDRRERRRLALDALERLGLGDRIYHRPGEMSGGQQQRVAIARAVAANPDILLADEPTGNLDSSASGDVMDTLKEHNAAGRTVILITHDMNIAEAASNAVCIKDGNLVEL